ncbi:hypothetical protein BC793_1665 [Actinoplanes xinjiangensis]|uniref:Uncharacterized protein n=1 Tax=Actinoplanes xinjiangensis TaxID=512350 RepID=A0A316E878_9ACTN|nr:hypothetical protein BC793_1665 [Actinoplanes xinjiangensis]
MPIWKGITTALEATPTNAAHWLTRSLTAEAGSQTAVSRSRLPAGTGPSSSEGSPSDSTATSPPNSTCVSFWTTPGPHAADDASRTVRALEALAPAITGGALSSDYTYLLLRPAFLRQRDRDLWHQFVRLAANLRDSGTARMFLQRVVIQVDEWLGQQGTPASLMPADVEQLPGSHVRAVFGSLLPGSPRRPALCLVRHSHAARPAVRSTAFGSLHLRYACGSVSRSSGRVPG